MMLAWTFSSGGRLATNSAVSATAASISSTIWPNRSLFIGSLPRPAREGAQEGDDRIEVGLWDLPAELVEGHRLDRTLQGIHRAIVKVGCRQLDVAQRGHLEDVPVGLLVGDVVAAEIRGR